MSKYLLQVNYVGEGIHGLLKDGGSSRHSVVEKLVKSLDGSVEAFYYALGETDLFVILDLPDNVTAAALALTVTASGMITCKVTVLLTPEEVDAATKKSPMYKAPGQ